MILWSLIRLLDDVNGGAGEDTLISRVAQAGESANYTLLAGNIIRTET